MKAEIRTDSESRSRVIPLVGQLPTRRNMNFGGAPNTRLRWWKSESLETIVKPCCSANDQIIESSVRSSPRVLTCESLGRDPESEGRFCRTGSHRAGASRGCNEELPFAVGGEGEASANIVTGKFGEVGENLGLGHAGGEILQNVLNSDSHATNTGLPAAFAWFDGDDVVVVHAQNVSSVTCFGKACK